MNHRMTTALRAVRDGACAAIVAAGTFAIPATPVLLTLSLADCAGSNAATISQDVVNDAQALANGFLGALPELKAIPGVNASMLSQVSVWAEDIANAAATLSPSLSQAEAAPTVENIVTLAGEIIAAFPAGILPPGVSIAFAAVQVLLPVLLAAVGVSPSATMMARAPAMSVEQARHVLGER
jgi:hypothetical protein